VCLRLSACDKGKQSNYQQQQKQTKQPANCKPHNNTNWQLACILTPFAVVSCVVVLLWL